MIKKLLNIFKSNDDKILTDYIVSVGIACRPAHYLRKHKLSRCSNPLDWMMNYTLDAVIQLFENNFNNFFLNRKEHIEKTKGDFRYIEDTSNGMVSVHHFSVDKDINLGYLAFKKTMKHRYNIMKNHMLFSDHILFISNRNEPIENFEKFLIEISKLFKCKCTYLNIRNSEINEKIEQQITPNLKIIDYSFNDLHPDGLIDNPNLWLGNTGEWNNIMKKIKITKRFFYLPYLKWLTKIIT